MLRLTPLLLISGICLLPNTSYGQTLNTILAKLQAVEERLNDIDIADQQVLSEKVDSITQHIAVRDAEQNEELFRLQERVEQLQEQSISQTPHHDVIKQSIDPVSARIGTLELEVADLRQNVANTDDESLGLLVSDLSGLVGELRTALSHSDFIEEHSYQNTPAAEAYDVDITGFGDFFYSFGDTENQDSHINIGQAELGIETNITDHIGFAGALVYEAGDEAFGIGDLLLDFNLVGTSGQLFQAGGIESGGIMVGQFDIPFGIGFHEYPSIDRKLISGPLVVEHTHGEWGDFGLQVYGESEHYNFALYGVNGFEYETATLEPVTPIFSTGGRIGLKLSGSLEIGGSYAGFLNDDTITDMALSGLDAQFSLSSFGLKGEYIEHQTGLTGIKTITTRGYYCQGLYDFGPCFAVARYGAFVADGNETIHRTSTGFGYMVREGLEFRIEYQANSLENDRTFFQMVLGI